MVLKRSIRQNMARSWFENDVEMYGAQTISRSFLPAHLFENDVEMYGAQTVMHPNYS